MASGYQVVRFTLVDFDGDWAVTTNKTGAQYVSTNQGTTFAVVFEGPTGTLTTYRYTVPTNVSIVVLGQLIFIPSHCQKQESGNTIKC